LNTKKTKIPNNVIWLVIAVSAFFLSAFSAQGFYPQITQDGNFDSTSTITIYSAGSADTQHFFETALSGSDLTRITLTFPLSGELEISPCQSVDSGINVSTSTTELGTYTALVISLYQNQQDCSTPSEQVNILSNAGNGIFTIVEPINTTSTEIIYSSSTKTYAFGDVLFQGFLIFIISVGGTVYLLKH